MLTIIVWARENHDRISESFKKEVKKDQHWEGFKIKPITVYERVCKALGYTLVRYDSIKNTLTICGD